MSSLVHQRCFNHAAREAVARCPECRQHFCRECITEHEDRVICSACLNNLARVPLLKRPAFARLGHVSQCLLGGLVAWFFFYLIGSTLARLPTSFHEGTLWKVDWMDQK